VNPISDTWTFLTRGGWTTLVFWLMLIASILIAAINLIRDEEQRSIRHLMTWIIRLCIGAMWWQQSLWKLPPTYTDRPDGSGGLRQWMKAMTAYASSELQRDFVKDVVLQHFYFFAPQVYLSEVLIAISLILGLFTRLGGMLGALMALNLWLGLYLSPTEWPWTYFFMFAIQVMFIITAPGRSLGLDAMILRREYTQTKSGGWRARFFDVAA
jgi:uncharacterized membrane protein YphA (DoxX/SURF4 family)